MNYDLDKIDYKIKESDWYHLSSSVTALKAMRMIFENLTTKEVQEDFEEMIRNGVDFYLAVSKFISFLNECDIEGQEEKGENHG